MKNEKRQNNIIIRHEYRGAFDALMKIGGIKFEGNAPHDAPKNSIELQFEFNQGIDHAEKIEGMRACNDALKKINAQKFMGGMGASASFDELIEIHADGINDDALDNDEWHLKFENAPDECRIEICQMIESINGKFGMHNHADGIAIRSNFESIFHALLPYCIIKFDDYDYALKIRFKKGIDANEKIDHLQMIQKIIEFEMKGQIDDYFDADYINELANRIIGQIDAFGGIKSKKSGAKMKIDIDAFEYRIMNEIGNLLFYSYDL